MTESLQVEWMRPQMMWALVVILPWLLMLHFRSLSDFPLWQRWLSLALRCGVVMLITLALAGLVWLVSTERRMVVVAIDRSESIDAAAEEVADRFAESLQQAAAEMSDVELRFLDFQRLPGELSPDRPPPRNDRPAPESTREQTITRTRGTAEPAGGRQDGTEAKERQEESPGTDIAAAIRTAVAAIPPSYIPTVVLLSDGNATTDDPVSAAASCGIPIWPVPLPQRSEPEVQLAAINAPAQVRQGEPFYLDVIVNSTGPASGFVDLYRGDIRIGEDQNDRVELQAGENRFRIRQSITAQRQVTFAARLRGFDATDTLLDNNEAMAIVAASGRPRVLLIDPDTHQTDSLRWALDEQKIDVEVRPAEGVPRDLTELQGYECLILSNVPATAMTMRQMQLIRSYVQDLGGGLVMLGGDQSFGLGGYYRTHLEEILPVRSNFEKEREKPSIAMVLVIDKSGSMGGQPMELAKDAAKAAVELLSPRDSIGVIAFDGDSYWVSELRTASDKGYILDRISTIEASGGTNMYPPMEDAYRALSSASAKLKHCILLTDGVSAPGDFEGLAAEMAASRITVSTVAMGQGASQQLLEDIARIGGGRYYFCDDPQSVPQVFAKETVEASKSAINELPFLPQQVRATQVLEGIELDLAPLLLGYVVTRPKPTSEFILASENGDPLLVWWRYGLGMTVAFTSDAKARWAAEWLTWPDFGPFWAQIIRHAMRKNDTRGIFVDVQRSDQTTTVVMDSVDDQGEFIDGQETTLTLIDPRLKTEQIPLHQSAPGRYEARLHTPLRGNYQLELAQSRPGGQAVRQSRGIVIGYPDELRLQPTNESVLRQIAEVSGGRFDASPTDLLQRSDASARKPLSLWPYLLMAALGLFLGDVALRRIDFARR